MKKITKKYIQDNTEEGFLYNLEKTHPDLLLEFIDDYKERTTIHSKERTLELARNYKGERFTKEYPSEYNHAARNLYIDELKENLKIRRIPAPKHEPIIEHYQSKCPDIAKFINSLR